MPFDGAAPEAMPPVPSVERNPAEAPALSPETLERIEREIAAELTESQREAHTVQTSMEAIVGDTRDDVPGTQEAVAADLAALAEQERLLAAQEARRQQIGRAVQAVRELDDQAMNEGFVGGGHFSEGSSPEAYLDSILNSDDPETIAASVAESGSGDAEAALEALQKTKSLEEEAIKTLEKEREAFRERTTFFKETLEMIATAKREAADAGEEISAEKRDELIAHCQARESSETFLQDINHYAGDKLRDLNDTEAEYSHPDIKTASEFVDVLLKKPIEQLETRIEATEKILEKDVLGEVIAEKKKRVHEQENVIETAEKEIDAAKNKPKPPVAETAAAGEDEEEASDAGDTDTSDS